MANPPSKQPPRIANPKRVSLISGLGNIEIVAPIKSALLARGHKVSIDVSPYRSESELRHRAIQIVKQSDCTIAFLSKNSFEEGGIDPELVTITNGELFGTIKTVLLDPFEEVNPPITATHTQWLDMSSWREELHAGSLSESPWFEHCMHELITMVEGEADKHVRGPLTTISNHLKVSVDVVKQASLHAKPFYGRAWLVDEVAAWLDDKESPQVCLMRGALGVGKTAFAAHLSRYDCRLSARVAASLFCDAAHSYYGDPKTFVKALAHLIACRIPAYREVLRYALNKGHQYASKSDDDLFDILIANPLKTAIKGEHEPMLIIVDSIDQLGDPDRNVLAESLARYIERLPTWMKVLVTSRDGAAATEPLATNAHEIALTGAHEANKDDVQTFLFKKICAVHPARRETIDALAENSEGCFLYAEIIADMILKEYVSADALAANCPNGLSELLGHYFAWTFHIPSGLSASYRNVLGFTAAADSGLLPLTALPMLGPWNDTRIRLFRNLMGVLITDTVNALGVPSLAFCNPFVAEWILSDAAGSYRCEAQPAVNLFVRRSIDRLMRNPGSLTNSCVLVVLTLYCQQYKFEALYSVLASLPAETKCFVAIKELWNHGAYTEVFSVCSQLRAMFSPYDETLDTRGLLLEHLAEFFSEKGLAADAMQLYEEALNTYRTEAYSSRMDSDITIALAQQQLASTLTELYCWSEAVDACREALDTFRDRDQAEPGNYTDDIAETLSTLAEALYRVGKTTQAQDTYLLALKAFRQASTEGSDARRFKLAQTLTKYAAFCEDQDELDTAKANYREALSIMWKLHKDDSAVDFDRSKLVDVLCRFASLLTRTQHLSEAMVLYRKALSLLQTLAEEDPDTHLPVIGRVLGNLATTYFKARQMKNAIDTQSLALQFIGSLEDEEPGTHTAELARGLVSFGKLLMSNNRATEAEIMIRGAVKLFRKRCDEDARFNALSLRLALNSLALALRRDGRKGDAEKTETVAETLMAAIKARDEAALEEAFSKVDALIETLETPRG